GKWFHMPGMAMLFSAELLRVADWRRRPRSHFLEGAMVYHDEWIHVLAQVCGRIAFLPDTLCFYRQHGVNVTGAPGPRLVDVSRDALSVGLDYYRNRGAQAREWSVLFAGLAAAEEDGDRRSRYERGSEAFGRLAPSRGARARTSSRARPARGDARARRGAGRSRRRTRRRSRPARADRLPPGPRPRAATRRPPFRPRVPRAP